MCINLNVEIMRKGWDESIQSDDGYVGVGIVFMTQSVSVKNVENSYPHGSVTFAISAKDAFI